MEAKRLIQYIISNLNKIEYYDLKFIYYYIKKSIDRSK